MARAALRRRPLDAALGLVPRLSFAEHLAFHEEAQRHGLGGKLRRSSLALDGAGDGPAGAGRAAAHRPGRRAAARACSRPGRASGARRRRTCSRRAKEETSPARLLARFALLREPESSQPAALRRRLLGRALWRERRRSPDRCEQAELRRGAPEASASTSSRSTPQAPTKVQAATGSQGGSYQSELDDQRGDADHPGEHQHHPDDQQLPCGLEGGLGDRSSLGTQIARGPTSIRVAGVARLSRPHRRPKSRFSPPSTPVSCGGGAAGRLGLGGHALRRRGLGLRGSAAGIWSCSCWRFPLGFVADARSTPSVSSDRMQRPVSGAVRRRPEQPEEAARVRRAGRALEDLDLQRRAQTERQGQRLLRREPGVAIEHPDLAELGGDDLQRDAEHLVQRGARGALRSGRHQEVRQRGRARPTPRRRRPRRSARSGPSPPRSSAAREGAGPQVPTSTSSSSDVGSQRGRAEHLAREQHPALHQGRGPGLQLGAAQPGALDGRLGDRGVLELGPQLRRLGDAPPQHRGVGPRALVQRERDLLVEVRPTRATRRPRRRPCPGRRRRRRARRCRRCSRPCARPGCAAAPVPARGRRPSSPRWAPGPAARPRSRRARRPRGAARAGGR